MDKKQIIKRKQYGDYNTVSHILSKKLGRYISPANARQMVEREKSQNHKEAVDALCRIVEAREKVLNSA
ncbi:MAG: hypothetical protein BWX87_00670 [Bacteroidetes bacterium ADurb.Bin123]|jgi:hypothetical protein|nr:MAG: hypothetical protein BWX87_00670 [Bacteroidetes bacterium ADurb.Bin123]